MQALGLMLMAAAAISGCSSQTETTEVPVNPNPVVVEEPEPMSLAFASVSNARAMTRLADEVVQLNNAAKYRSISDFRLVAVKKDENVMSVSNAVIDKPNVKDYTTTRYYHFNYCDMSYGTNRCLVYAKAVDATPTTAVFNGNLKQVMPTFVTSTADIYFEPVSIYSDATVGDDGIHADAWTLANALTDIANIQKDENFWSASNNKDLKLLFINFTNNGYDLPGSAASVRNWIEAVIEAADGLSFEDGTVEKQIRQEIMAKASAYLDDDNTSNILSLNYPQNINLPDGAAVVRWAETADGKKFVPQLQTTTLDDINSVSRFVYPPALYYFVNSDIWTSISHVTFDTYKNRTKWKGDDDNSVQKLFLSGGTITPNTKTVAVADPLQYAVAQLQVKVKVADDADETNLKYNGTATILIQIMVRIIISV